MISAVCELINSIVNEASDNTSPNEFNIVSKSEILHIGFAECDSIHCCSSFRLKFNEQHSKLEVSMNTYF